MHCRFDVVDHINCYNVLAIKPGPLLLIPPFFLPLTLILAAITCLFGPNLDFGCFQYNLDESSVNVIFNEK